MKTLLTTLLLLFASYTFAQQSHPSASDTIRTFAEQMPSFPGGQDAMMKFLVKNVQYPQEARENGKEGRVITQFVVSDEGEIRDITMVGKELGYGFEAEALRVIQLMPKWEPGMIGGKPVSVKFTLPIAFKLQ
jgi:protein TonB